MRHSIDSYHPINREYHLTNGLQNFWWADPNNRSGFKTGVLRDLCRNSDGILINNPVWDMPEGEIGQKGSISGGSVIPNYVLTNETANYSNSLGLTLVYHGRCEVNVGAGSAIVISDSVFDNHDFGIFAGSANSIQGWVRSADGTRYSATIITTVAPIDYWWVVADNSTLRTYRALTLLGQTAKNPGFDVQGKIAIGNNGDREDSPPLTFKCFSAAIWQRALTLDEMAQYMIDSKQGFPQMVNRYRRRTYFFVDETPAQPFTGTMFKSFILRSRKTK